MHTYGFNVSFLQRIVLDATQHTMPTDSTPKDTNINSCTKIVNVRYEHVSLSLLDELFQQARVVEALVNVTVAWWIPAAMQ